MTQIGAHDDADDAIEKSCKIENPEFWVF